MDDLTCHPGYNNETEESVLRRRVVAKDADIARLTERAERAEQRCKRLEEALRFYAYAGPLELASDVLVENGLLAGQRKARAALEGDKK